MLLRFAALLMLMLSFAQASDANVACPALFGDEQALLAMQPIERVGYSHPLFPVVEKIVRLRYDIDVEGMLDIESRGRRGILFAMNHPSFSDPAIVSVALKAFHPSPVMAQSVVEMPGIGKVIQFGTDKVDAMYVPRIGNGDTRAEHTAKVKALIADVIARLARGENVVLWPAGELMHEDHSTLGQKRMLAEVIAALPNVRIVLGRTTGLWGSAFGHADGAPNFGAAGAKAAGATVSRVLMGPLTPQRHVKIELFEPADLPRNGGRTAINQYVESWYNEVPQPLVRVPYGPRVR